MIRRPAILLALILALAAALPPRFAAAARAAAIQRRPRAAAAATPAVPTAPADPVAALRARFASPPDAARPWVYWFWLNGNVTREGITADLEAMKRAGIGGALIMETDQGAPAGKADFGSPAWRELFKHVCKEAARLGLEITMNNDAGWCGSGGPWITPEMSMQRVVWTETPARGGRKFQAVLPQPAAVKGYYKDIAVLAYPTPSKDARIPNIGMKSAAVTTDYWTYPFASDMYMTPAWPAAAPAEVVARDRILDLTSRMAADGTLSWDVPDGGWTILRLGHTSTGVENHPAPVPGLGLESDKLSRAATEFQYNALIKKLVADIGPLAGKTLVSTHIDSWETGSQNWTPGFREEFQRRRGYDLAQYFPVLAGRIVESREVSERFLWDLRRTVNDLILENYAGAMRDLARRDGLRLSIEAYTSVPVDELAYAGRADEPMAEFWSWWFGTGQPYGFVFSDTEMTSAAHVYGKRIVGAEAFTANDLERWQGHPGTMKELGDWAFTEGINRFVFHRYAMQPWTSAAARPGMSMGPWGLHYERTQTWWDLSSAYHRYLARCQDLLRQGLPVGDVLYLTPEGSRHAIGDQRRFKAGSANFEEPRDRARFHYDLCPPDALMTRVSVKDGRLVLPEGTSYRLLVLPKVETMTPALLGKVKELVEAGATVVGGRPVKSPSLSDYPQGDAELARLADTLWGTGPAPADLAERKIGAGRMFWSAAFQPSTRPAPAPRDLLKSARWVWASTVPSGQDAPPGMRYFRRTVDIPAGRDIASARVAITADSGFSIFVNGRRVGYGNDSTSAYLLDANGYFKTGPNLVMVRAENSGDKPSPAGLVGAVTVEFKTGQPLVVTTDGKWEWTETLGLDWPTGGAPDARWAAAREVGRFGAKPWGDLDQTYQGLEYYPEEDLVGAVLDRIGAGPDFSYQAASVEPSLRYTHRTLGGGAEIYFVANKTPRAQDTVCTFRVADRRPELWQAETGNIVKPGAYKPAEGVTRVPISFGPYESFFVVFAEPAEAAAARVSAVTSDGREVAAGGSSPEVEVVRSAGRLEAEVRRPGRYGVSFADGGRMTVEVTKLPAALEISGPWDVTFPPGGGAPERVAFDRLASWSEHPAEGVRFFSGTATYTTTFRAPAEMVGRDVRAVLDLGRVEVIAEATLNGKPLGIAWRSPYVLDAAGALRAGENRLEVRVANLWINRQIGDQSRPEDSERNPDGTLKSWPQWLQDGKASPAGRLSFTSWRLWKTGDPLVPSGLLGPVRITGAARRPLSR